MIEIIGSVALFGVNLVSEMGYYYFQFLKTKEVSLEIL
jgi:hypothetical protein